MCGFLGYYGSDKNIYSDLERIKKASKSLERRGPDSNGTRSMGNCLMHHRRLSIIDTGFASDQPFYKRNKDFLLSFNGEIYNYKLLRDHLKDKINFSTNSDTEVLYNGLILYGINFIKELEGMFAFAFYDKRKNSMILSRDRFGEKPLYFLDNKDGFFFASDINSILNFSLINPEVSKTNFIQYLAHGYYPQPLTPFSKIHKLESGKYIEIKDNKFELNSYWNINTNTHQSKCNDLNDLKKEMENYVESSLVSDVPISLSLSAGIDSSTIASICSNKKLSLKTFSIGYQDKIKNDERKEAKDIAKFFNHSNNSIEIESILNIEEFKKFAKGLVSPIADISGFAQYNISKKVKKEGLKVLISGLGADELFFGYPYLSETVIINNKFQFINKRLRGIIPTNFFTIKVKNFLRKYRFYFSEKSMLHKIIYYFYYIYHILIDRTPLHYPISISLSGAPLYYNPNKNLKIIENLTGLDIKNNLFYVYKKLNKYNLKNTINWTHDSVIQTWLEGNLLSMADSVGMNNSVEIRSPFLNHKLLRKTSHYIENNFNECLIKNKQIMKLLIEELLPDFVLKRKKTGFVPPVNNWINYLWGKLILENNKNFILNELGLINKEYLFSNELNETFKYRIIILNLWFQNLFEESSFSHKF
tara:strand:+ start:3450 stop:5387 length:1938 start_codon:yes stop_codon:yes gene_type:complete